MAKPETKVSDPGERERRAKRAQAILADPMIEEFFEKTRRDAWRLFADSRGSDDEARKDAWMLVKALEKLESNLKAHIQSYAVEQHRNR